jgi:hypothetical protein
VTGARRAETCREGGFALPLALAGLVVVSLLLCTALVTASSELAMSGAHEGAMRARYDSESAIAAFLAEQPGALALDSVTTVFAPPLGAAVELHLLRLGEEPLSADTTLRIVALTARPNGQDSRAVSVLVKVLMPPPDALGVTATGCPWGRSRRGSPARAYNRSSAP